MQIVVRYLKPGDKITFQTRIGDLVAGAEVNSIGQTEYQSGTARCIVCNGGEHIFGKDLYDTVQTPVENLVPPEKRDHLGPIGKTPYEVLLFVTRREYLNIGNVKNTTKRIYAKFRDYQEALEYAQKKAVDPTYYHVILRA
jgi:hypothetical protein